MGILSGTNYTPLVADLFLSCYERYFMISHSDDTQADIIETFNSNSRYLDEQLNIKNVTLKKCSLKFILLNCS